MDIFRRRFYNDRDHVRKVAYVSNQFIKLVPPPPGLVTAMKLLDLRMRKTVVPD